MMIDTITMIIGGAVLLLALLTPFINGLIRKPIISEGIQALPEADISESIQEIQDADEGITVIITPHENAAELEHNLPMFLDQQYRGDYQVVVVIWKGDSETEDVLKRYASHPRLYYTYIPDSSRYMSRKKLAITLGVKAAKHEWLLLTDAECRPATNRWLQTMARNCTDDKNLVIGYTRYDDETGDYRRFERLHTAFYLMREDTRGIAYRHNGCNLMFRKSEFIKGHGFRDNLKYLRGEYDFIVNKYATADGTALETAEDAWMTEQEPTEKGWRNKHLFYIENRQHMRRSFRHRVLYNIDQGLMHLNDLAIIGSLAFAILTQRWLLAVIIGIAFLLTVVLRTIIGSKAVAFFHEDIPSWKIVPYEISLLWNNLRFRLKYLRADKYDFISHKL